MIRTVTVRSGSIVIEWDPGLSRAGEGNLLIYKSHTPSDSITIERADIDDLMVALDGVLRHRQTRPT